jgi:hypothetical protein
MLLEEAVKLRWKSRKKADERGRDLKEVIREGRSGKAAW